MKLLTLTACESKSRARKWKRTFALTPKKVADGEWRWLEFVEYRVMPVGKFPMNNWVTQYRSIGSTDHFPEYPRVIGDTCVPPMPKDKPAVNYPELVPIKPTEFDYVSIKKQPLPSIKLSRLDGLLPRVRIQSARWSRDQELSIVITEPEVKQ